MSSEISREHIQKQLEKCPPGPLRDLIIEAMQYDDDVMFKCIEGPADGCIIRMPMHQAVACLLGTPVVLTEKSSGKKMKYIYDPLNAENENYLYYRKGVIK